MSAVSPSSSAPNDTAAMLNIRRALSEHPPVEPQPVAEREAEQAAYRAALARGETPQPPKGQAPAEPQRRARADRVNQQAEAHRVADAQIGKMSALLAGAKARIASYRPKPKHLLIAGAVLLVLLRPWLVLGLVFLTVFGVAVLFLILGYDGFWQRGMRLARWYANRRPDRAQVMHQRLDDFACKWDAVLDRFPEGSVDALYLPDFGDLAAADARHTEAVDRRLQSMQEG